MSGQHASEPCHRHISGTPAYLKKWRLANKSKMQRYNENFEHSPAGKATREAYRARHHPEITEKRKKGKLEALRAYSQSEPTCACCGENNLKHLTLDHIGGGGNKHLGGTGYRLSGMGLYSWLKMRNYPSGFRVLCWNCNMAIGQFGTCGHQDNGTSGLENHRWVPFVGSMAKNIPRIK